MLERWVTLTLIVMLFFAAGSFFGKVALLRDTSPRVYFFEAIGTLTVFTTFVLFNREKIFPNFSVNYFGLLMGLTWGIGTILFIYVLKIGKLSVILPLTALYPGITVLLAVVFLKETLGPREIAGIVLALISGMLLAR
ncbi:MAG: EamA family transporter [Candidatus Dadabacteria bacterium]|nr:EamA family transporter [Candidatus Dadabacteria bacterium]